MAGGAAVPGMHPLHPGAPGDEPKVKRSRQDEAALLAKVRARARLRECLGRALTLLYVYVCVCVCVCGWVKRPRACHCVFLGGSAHTRLCICT